MYLHVTQITFSLGKEVFNVSEFFSQLNKGFKKTPLFVFILCLRLGHTLTCTVVYVRDTLVQRLNVTFLMISVKKGMLLSSNSTSLNFEGLLFIIHV